MIATLFGRRSEQIGRLYFADLLGAGIACAVVVSLISRDRPAGDDLPGRAGPRRSPASASPLRAALACTAFRSASSLRPVLAVGCGGAERAPRAARRRRQEQVRPSRRRGTRQWSPIFRVDVVDFGPDRRLLYHDGLLGSVIYRWDGEAGEPRPLRFDTDPRRFPFAVRGTSPDNVLIIGAAGGHEILRSLYFDAGHIDAVELNPVTHDLVTDKFADYAGHLADNPAVNYVHGDGRSFLARSDDTYDLVWFPAPTATRRPTRPPPAPSCSPRATCTRARRSRTASSTSAATASSPRSSASSTTSSKPNRTARYVSTARHALGELGVDDPAGHILVATSPRRAGRIAAPRSS